MKQITEGVVARASLRMEIILFQIGDGGLRIADGRLRSDRENKAKLRFIWGLGFRLLS